jgi:hypothetical protein
LPDAMIELEGRPHIIEFGGSYSKEKLESFYEYCTGNHFSYEIW